MILILINWIYILLLSFGWGITATNLDSRFKISNISLVVLLGLFFQMVCLHFYAIFQPVNLVWYILNTIAATGFIFLKRAEALSILNNTITSFLGWNRYCKILFLLISGIALMQSATVPYIPDNESYYLQSIKWLNEYGLVRGLANLHIYFGQMSGWHILQSAFNFGFISNRLNDINGFIVVVTAFYSIGKLNRYFKEQQFSGLFLGLIFISGIFIFQFVNTPSPDLPVFLVSQIIFYQFYRGYKNNNANILFMVFMGLFLTLIKVIVFPLLLLPLLLLIKKRAGVKSYILPAIACFISFVAFAFKNYIISGYLLYPTPIFGEVLHPVWQLPQSLQDFYYRYTKMAAYTRIKYGQYVQMNQWQIFKVWLFEPKLRVFFNTIMIGLLVVFPFFIKKRKVLWWLYGYMVLQFLLLYITSPQYRFFFPQILCMASIILAFLVYSRPKMVKYILITGAILPLFSLFFTVNIQPLTNNKFTPPVLYAFKFSNIIIPEKNSRFDFQVKKVKDGNLVYFSPSGEGILLWFNGDLPLPAVNEKQIRWFEKKQHIRPQMISTDMGDGFYSEQVKE